MKPLAHPWQKTARPQRAWIVTQSHVPSVRVVAHSVRFEGGAAVFSDDEGDLVTAVGSGHWLQIIPVKDET